MKIARIFAHRVELPLVEGSYKWAGGKSVTVFDSTIVGVETDCGLVGYGEVCPLGPFYLPAYAEGVQRDTGTCEEPLNEEHRESILSKSDRDTGVGGVGLHDEWVCLR